MIEVVEYLDDNNESPFGTWLGGLDDSVQARIAKSIGRLAYGTASTAKGVGAGTFEIRLDFGPGYRIYFGKDGEQIVVLLAGGTKRRQSEDIEAARNRWQDYKRRKRAENATHKKVQ